VDNVVENLEKNEGLKKAYHKVGKATKDVIPVVQAVLVQSVDKVTEAVGGKEDGDFFNEKIL
jgi:hypothetical protein